MAKDFLSDITSTVLTKTLDAAVARQKAIANNIANVQTPGYKRSYISFESELKSILEERSERAAGRRLAGFTPSRRTDLFSPSRPDGNNVNIDAEIADLTRTSLKQKAVTAFLEGRIATLRLAITEGKR